MGKGVRCGRIRDCGAPRSSVHRPQALRVLERFGADIWGAPNADPVMKDPIHHLRPSVHTETVKAPEVFQRPGNPPEIPKYESGTQQKLFRKKLLQLNFYILGGFLSSGFSSSDL